ncbi:anti-sigma-F factor Fin [Caldalkalibacillus salinus]|uniref:anti-sigma-F factor Fin n=1 Tax=Caldalkalibacillus salinus TaxID=2803787 RepID=UPI0019230242|nr:anti-sigma-F factor Fin [Caldalkalibacillus salinus]
MAIRYVCRYCNHHLGDIRHQEVEEEKLGFHALSATEREQMLQYQENGDIIAQVCCEHCQETIQRYPELLLQTDILQ